MQVTKQTKPQESNAFSNLVVLDKEGTLVGYLNVPSRMFADVKDLKGIQGILADGHVT